MSSGDPPESVGRPEKSGRLSHIVTIDPLSSFEETEAELAHAKRLASFKRNERWENSRQILVLFSLGAIALILLIAFVLSVWVLLPRDINEQREIARWVLETEASGLVAGLIGLWAVKSFEK